MFLVSYKARFLVATAVLALGGLVTGAQAATGDAAAGAGKAEEMCSGCHGADGNSEDAIIPSLAGQYAGYIAKQVKDFQSGHRANDETMAGMASMVESNQDALDMGAFFEQQKIKGMLTKPNKDLVAEGERIYRDGNSANGVFPCVSCHGESGKGKSKNNSAFPVIAGQHRDYTIKQMKDFRSGARTNDPAGMMNMLSQKITDKEIEALAEYLSAQF